MSYLIFYLEIHQNEKIFCKNVQGMTLAFLNWTEKYNFKKLCFICLMCSRAVLELMGLAECLESQEERYSMPSHNLFIFLWRAVHHFELWDYCSCANIGVRWCYGVVMPWLYIRAGRQRIWWTPWAAWWKGTQGESWFGLSEMFNVTNRFLVLPRFQHQKHNRWSR